MKNIFMIAAMALISSASFAQPFTAKGSETRFYYAPYTAEAAEAQMWKSALDSCKSNDATSNALPVKVSDLSMTEHAYLVTVSAQFLCFSADKGEIEK